MIELIKITTSKGGKQVCSARELHERLETQDQFTQWAKRMFEYGFVEGSDYQALTEMVYAGPGLSKRIDYVVTIECAKEIAMIQRTDKGREIRKYFIECERKLKQVHLVPQSFSEALMLAANNQRLIEEQQKQIATLEPKAQYFDAVKDAQNAITMDEVVKLLNKKDFGRNRLFKFLQEKNVLTKKKLPYQQYMDRGYFNVIQHSYVDNKGALHTYPQVLVFPKGVSYINKILTMP